MSNRFLVFLLLSMLGLAAFDGAELRREWRSSSPSIGGDTGTAKTMDGGNPWPPKP